MDKGLAGQQAKWVEKVLAEEDERDKKHAARTTGLAEQHRKIASKVSEAPAQARTRKAKERTAQNG